MIAMAALDDGNHRMLACKEKEKKKKEERERERIKYTLFSGNIRHSLMHLNPPECKKNAHTQARVHSKRILYIVWFLIIASNGSSSSSTQ